MDPKIVGLLLKGLPKRAPNCWKPPYTPDVLYTTCGPILQNPHFNKEEGGRGPNEGPSALASLRYRAGGTGSTEDLLLIK